MGPSDDDLIAEMRLFMNQTMKNYDPSHDAAHVERVVTLSQKLLRHEMLGPRAIKGLAYNSTVVILAALMHDIEDHKYQSSPSIDNKSPRVVYNALLDAGASSELAQAVETIVSHVSYSKEKKDPAVVTRLIGNGFPELALVQDADRLDAIGAIGIGRCFTFLGAKGKDSGAPWKMESAMEHLRGKLMQLQGTMKTEAGRSLAAVRTQRLREFESWWRQESMNDIDM
ncbi:HD superfamily hydrolase [Fusarium pseudoanthophilum]|uniref:HD superfamily hydrolase n=1 Tax=Fusarium pseudoanthophilum TaxID=48495 RepID=A0A8H5PPJ7_9HYPO|nr:HD superfamily hydrolase [Fusarium pseudoanthophilum]